MSGNKKDKDDFLGSPKKGQEDETLFIEAIRALREWARVIEKFIKSGSRN